MAIKKVIKLMDQIREFADDGGLKDDDLTKEYGNAIQERLNEGFYGGYNIEGHRFKKLKESTINIRKYRGRYVGSLDSILLERGGIRDFLKSDNLLQTGKVQVKLNKPPQEYMIDQNEGFTTGGFIKGKTVPARKWYGIPKAYREGGTKYNEFLKKFTKRVEKNLAEAIKRAR